MTRKLKDALAKAAGLSLTEEPVVIVPATDPIANLEDMAKKGFNAVAALCVERNDKADLAANLFQKLNVVQANNVELREREDFWRSRCEAMTDVNSRLQAHLNQARILFQLIAQEIHRGNVEVSRIRPLQPASNNPDLPPVDMNGLPIDDEPDQLVLEQKPIPNGSAVTVDNERMKELIAKLDKVTQEQRPRPA